MAKRKNQPDENETEMDTQLLHRMDERQKAMSKKLDDFIDTMNDKLDGITTQTTATNGRVGKLENWRSAIMAAIVVISVLIGWVLQILFGGQ